MGLKNLTKKQKIIFILAGVFILFVIISFAFVIAPEPPGLCATCHIMKPYYNSWKESTHNEVNCLECHSEPGLKGKVTGKIEGAVQLARYVTNTYTKPSAQVNDVSCLRAGCHKKEELGSKKVTFRNNIEFEHSKHFGELGADIQLKCTNCHRQLTSDNHITVDTNTCFTCHFKDVPLAQLSKQCLNCHSGIKKSGEHKEYTQGGATCADCHEGIKTGAAEVREQICYFCHAGKNDIEKIKDSELMHKAHSAENKVDCVACHNSIEHKG